MMCAACQACQPEAFTFWFKAIWPIERESAVRTSTCDLISTEDVGIKFTSKFCVVTDSLYAVILLSSPPPRLPHSLWNQHLAPRASSVILEKQPVHGLVSIQSAISSLH